MISRPIFRTLSARAKFPAIALATVAALAGVSLTGCGGGGSSAGVTPITSPTPSPTASPTTIDKSVSPDGLKTVTTIPFRNTTGSLTGYNDLYILLPGMEAPAHADSGGYGIVKIADGQPVIWSPSSDRILYKIVTGANQYTLKIATFGGGGIASTVNGTIFAKDSISGETSQAVRTFKMDANYTFEGFSADGTTFQITGVDTERYKGTVHYSLNMTTGLITIVP